MRNYISGWYALNTPDENGDISDWHPYCYWLKTVKSEEVPLFSYNPVLGDVGITRRDITWSDEPVYIADFARAFADLLWQYPNDHPYVLPLYGSRHSLMTPTIEEKLYGHLLKLPDQNRMLYLVAHILPNYYRKAKNEIGFIQ